MNRSVIATIPTSMNHSAVSKYRDESAVGELGVIETGLSSARNSRCLSRVSDDVSSLGGDTQGGGRSTNTGASSRPGRCVVRKATAKAGVLLHPMRVDIPPASITAIVGPAGSGRSTLLNFLAGSLDRSVIAEGSVNLPGTKSFLQEQTYFHSFYTPRTYIKHYDRLTTGTRKGGKSKEEIEHLLDSLGIPEERRDTVVGDIFRRGLSNGEKRRLELGLMVLSAPDTLFCDSPTDGLDSETSLRVMEFLKGYCSHPGRRVILTINKPSSLVWTLIDNVILLSKGKVIYEGPRFDMESFFAFNKFPTPKRFSPIEHYLSVVSDYRKTNKRGVDDWADSFKKWQEEADEDEGDELAADVEACFPANIREVVITRSIMHSSHIWKKVHIFSELVRRYSIDLWLNPGILWIRLAMYSMLSLFIGLLFFDLGYRTSYASIQSRCSVLFYSVSFFIFMVVAVLPFTVHDQAVMAKEVFNGYYHPVVHHCAVTIGTIPGVIVLAFVTTAIMVPMTKFHAPFYFFLNMLLSLFCAESLAQLVSIQVKSYILGIVGLAGLFGFFMLLQGFMLVPSEFPSWLRWAYNVPFHTYSWRSFMYLEFSGDDNVFDSVEFPTGVDVLKAYEIDQVNVSKDMLVLFGYGLILHFFSISTVIVKNRFFVRRLKED